MASAELRLEEDTQPLLRPHQIEEMREEVDRLKAMLDPNAPEGVRGSLQDRAEAVRQLRSINRQLGAQTPQAFEMRERDRAVAMERELRERITAGMPTSAEMRRNPPGAVDRHRAWERRHKADIMRWKNLRLRLHASGMLDDVRDARDVANLERFRPGSHLNELSMEGAQIPQRRAFHGLDTFVPGNMMDENEAAALRAETALFMEALREADPAKRAQTLAFLRGETQAPVAVAEKPASAAPPPKR